MKTPIKNTIVAAAFTVFFGAVMGTNPAAAAPQLSASIQINARADFEAPLAPEGTWVEVGTYGRCWHPRGVAVEWRPYCEGQWVWTDCGWYWDSDEPWAWACYHYGSWVDEPDIGWCWVPDIEWAPAWVEWRVGGGHIGWAPCAPSGVVVAPGFFAFVELGHFHDHVRPANVVFNNPTIINQTTRMAEFKHENRTIDGRQQRVAINEGPGVGAIEKATGRKETATPVQNVLHARSVVRDAKPSERPAELRQEQRPVVPERQGLPDSTIRPRESTPATREPVAKPVQPEQRPAVPERRDLPGSTIRPRESTPATREPVTKPVQPVQPPVERPVTPPVERPINPPVQERHLTPVSPRQPWTAPRQPVVPPPKAAPAPQPEKPVTPPREGRPDAVPHEERPAVPSGGGEKDKGRGRDGGGGLPACQPSTRSETI